MTPKQADEKEQKIAEKKTVEKIIPAIIDDEMKASYLDYAMSVIIGRALPDARDGLKPVHRRILYAMNDMGMRHNTATKKSARIVGECFIKDTLVLTSKGLIPIQDIKTGDEVLTQAGSKKVSELFEMPKKTLLRITLENGLKNTVTASQKIKVLNDKLEYEWKAAEKLTTKDYVVTRSAFPEIKKEVIIGKGKILNSNLAYLLGFLMSDGWIELDKRLGFYAQYKEIIEHIAKILKKEFYYTATIEEKQYEYLSKKQGSIKRKGYTLRINRKEINDFFINTFNLKGIKAPSKHIPLQILQSPKTVIYSFISGLVDGDGSIHIDRNVIHYGSVSEKLIDDFQVLLQCLGIFSRKYVDKAKKTSTISRGDRAVNHNFDFISLEIRGVYASILAQKLNLHQPIKSERLKKLIINKKLPLTIDKIPFAAKVIFEELSKKHLGSGWYEDDNNKKFRMGIKYKSGCKIRYAKNLKDKALIKSQIIDWNILAKLNKIHSPNYSKIKEMLDNELCFLKVRDISGCKPECTYDLQVAEEHEFIANCMLSHNCLGKYHPHGDTAVYDAMVRMAQDFSLRYPLVIGQGNMGSIDGDNPAHMRYCITGDSLILTNSGIIPISEISDKEEDKISIKTLGINGKINRATKFFNCGKHPTAKIITTYDYEIEGSLNHPILVWKIGLDFKPIISWKTLEEIQAGDVVVLNRASNLFSSESLNLTKYHPKTGFKNNISLPTEMNDDLAFLLGAFVSEGSFHNQQILFNNSDPEFYNKVKSIIKKQFVNIQIYERKIKGGCTELSIYEQKAVQFMKNIGLKNVKSDLKEIPFSVLMSTKSNIQSFLKALFEGDGSVDFKSHKAHKGNSIEISYTSKSKTLIKQLKTLLLSFGIVTNSHYVDKRSGCYKLLITTRENALIFAKEIDFFSERKKTVLTKARQLNSERLCKNDFIPFLSDYIRNKYNNWNLLKYNFDRYAALERNKEMLRELIDDEDSQFIDWLIKNQYLFLQVKEKIMTGKKNVYSVKIDSPCHSFVANGFINHNTEAKLAKISDEMIADIDKETVDFTDNFDGSLKEPVVLPSKIPNLLINGSSGIAVGMATNVPPHNIKEVCQAVVSLVENPEIEIRDIIKIITGPDFPTGGIILGRSGIIETYTHGRGSIDVRAKIDIEDKKDRQSLIVKEIPYQLNKSTLIEQMADCINEKIVQGVSDLRDESDRNGMRIVLELKKGANAEVVKNQLYKHTRLQSSFGAIMLALQDNQPKTMNIKELLVNFLHHRQIVVRKRTAYDLRKAEERDHVILGLLIALEHLDPVIKLIKESKTPEAAKNGLMKDYKLSEVQSQAILEMKLQRLTGLEQQKIKNEHKELIETIKKLKEILSDEKRILGIIKDEMKEIIQKYGDERRTIIEDGSDDELLMEDLVKPEDNVITISHAGYIKRQPLDAYKSQRRGGKGIIGATTKDEDFIEHLFIANTHSYLLVFTDNGKVHWLKVYSIPEAARTSKGKPIINLIRVEPNEKIQAVIPVKEFDDTHYLIFATRKGLAKKTNLSEYGNPRQGGIIAIALNEGDEVIDVVLTDGRQQILIATKNGQAVKFAEQDVRSVGRGGVGVRGIRLELDDDVIGMIIADDKGTILTVTENGYGKRSSLEEYRFINRGGKGVKNIMCSDRNGKVVSVTAVIDDDDIMLVSKNGIIIRMPAKNINVIGRNTQGVRIMKLEAKDKVVAVTKLEANEEESSGTGQPSAESSKTL